MGIDPHTLPEEASLLRQIVLQLLGVVEEKDRLLERVQHQLKQLLRQRYGQKRERIDENQLFLFFPLGILIVARQYGDHLPLNRLESIFQRQGVELSRKTMCGWMGACGELAGPVLGTHETGGVGLQSCADRRHPSTRTGRGVEAPTSATCSPASAPIQTTNSMTCSPTVGKLPTPPPSHNPAPLLPSRMSAAPSNGFAGLVRPSQQLPGGTCDQWYSQI